MTRLTLINSIILCLFLGCSDDKGEKMKEVKDLYGNTIGLDSENQVIMKNYLYNPKTIFDETPAQKQISDKNFLQQEKLRATKLLNTTNQILSSSPYASYTPSYLDTDLSTSQGSRDSLFFLEWQKLYLQEPSKGSIAPWTKEEKAYYLALKTKKERYVYLVKRSGLRCAIIDMPPEAIGNAKAFPEITELVESNRNTLKSDLHMGEWGICAGILGDANGFAEGTAVGSVRVGFKARCNQALFLYYQLTGDLVGLSESYIVSSFTWGGVGRRPLKASLLKAIEENPPIDEFGMIPFLDEIIEPDWIMDFNKFPYVIDGDGDVTYDLSEEIKAGKLLDPREARSTKTSREEFRAKANFFLQRKQKNSSIDFPYDPDWKNPSLVDELSILSAKIMAVTPPEGYINAPYYYFPEELQELYEAGKLDRKLDPRIPAINRVSFPKDLKKKIEAFSKK